MAYLEKKPLPAPFNDARPGFPIVVSHRAGANEAPENTLAALRNAEKAGSKLMQMDILQVADGTPVIVRDSNLKRTHGVDLAVKSILSANNLPPFKEILEPLLPLEGAKPLNTGSFKDGRRIPTLEELLKEANPDTFLLLEVWEEDQSLVERVVDLIKKAGCEKRVILGNPFSTKTWMLCREAMPSAPTILPLSEVWKLYAFYMFGLISFWRPPSPSIVLDVPLLTTDWYRALEPPEGLPWQGKLVTWALFQFLRWLIPRPKLFLWLQERGIPVVVFILNRPVDWESALSLDGISGIMTDDPTALRDYLRTRGSKKVN